MAGLTPHNNAQKGDIAKTVLMPGDPLRAKFIADNYLEDVKCVNTVRNMFAYTGTYQGKEVTIMAHGMGIPSVGIYTYELFNFYDVDNIIRIGSAGALQDDINLKDVVVVMGASTNSNYASQYNFPGTFAPIADFGLVKKAVEVAEEKNIPVKVGNVMCSDIFYNDDPTVNDRLRKMGILAVEMESAGLFMNAARAGKKALCLLTISDHIYKQEELTAEERQIGFRDMMEIALGLI